MNPQVNGCICDGQDSTDLVTSSFFFFMWRVQLCVSKSLHRSPDGGRMEALPYIVPCLGDTWKEQRFLATFLVLPESVLC